MHRLLTDSASLDETHPRLGPEAARHLRVVRPKAGEVIELFDGKGAARLYRCADATTDSLEAVEPRARKSPSPARPLTLFACLTKGSRWDWTIEKATELGVSRIVPVLSARTIVRLDRAERPAKCARWRRIAEDAARQSSALWIPEILEAVDFADALVLVRQTTCFVGALTSPPSPPLLQAVRDRCTALEAPALFVGPEGDFAPEELQALLACAIPTSFGPLVLRAETAAIYGLAVLAAARDATKSFQGENL